MNSRENWVDWAKTVGIYLVVFGHVFFPTDAYGCEIKNFVYAFHMPLFFFLSGYLFKKKEGFFCFAKKNVKSLIVPYIFFNVLCCLLDLPLISDVQFHKNAVADFLIGGGHSYSGASWFLLSLFFVRLLAYITVERNIWHQFSIFAVSIFVAYLLPFPLYWGIGACFMAYPFFYVGYIFKKYAFFSKKVQWNFCVGCLSLVSLLLLNRIVGPVSIHSLQFGKVPSLYYIEGFVGVIMVSVFCRLVDNYSNVFIGIFSSGSIVIMGLHGSMFFYVNALSRRISPLFADDWSNFFFALIKSAVILVLLYYPIIFLQKHAAMFIGNRSKKIESRV